MKKYYLLIFTILSQICFGQIEISTIVDEEIMVCQDPARTEIIVINSGASLAQQNTMILNLPTGIKFTNHQVIYGSNIIQTSNLADSSITFSIGNIAAGDSIKLEVNYKAFANSISQQEDGEVFRNKIEFTSSYGTKNHTSDSYNILFPALNITNITPNQTSILSGTSTQRAITIVNAGFGKTDNLVLLDSINNQNLTLNGTDIGNLNGNKITLGANDFQNIGNGDIYFDLGESIVITESLSGTSCSNQTATSTFNVSWGCENQSLKSTNSYANISIDFQTPNLTIQTTASENTCHKNSSEQKLTLNNTGSGIATNIVLDIFKSSGGNLNDDIISQFILNSIVYQIDGNGYVPASSILNYTTGQNTGLYACLGANPINSITLAIPDMVPGQVVDIKWDMNSCCLTSCADESITGWGSEVNYNDICSTSNYTKNKIGQGTTSHKMTLFTEASSDIFDLDSQDYHFIVSSFENSLPIANNARYKLVLNIDNGLSFNSLNFTSNGISWTPLSISQPSQNSIEALYEIPNPFTISKSEIILNVSGDCGNAGWKNVGLQIFLIPDPSCTSCEVPMVCQENFTTYLHCPLANCSGLRSTEFKAERISLGQADNDLDGIADISGVLDLNKIKRNRCMVGDTLLTTLKGVVNSNNSYEYLYYNTSNNFGDVLDFVEAELILYKSSSNSYYTLPINLLSSSINAPSKTFNYDLSSPVIVASIPSLNGFQFENGDSIEFSAKYKVVNSVINGIQESIFENDFYLSQVNNPSTSEKESCDFRNDRITFIGYSFINDNANNVTINNCDRLVSQNFGMSIGDAPSNYAGGNLFPFEYRHWGYLSEVQLVIPQNYNWNEAIIQYKRTLKTNSISTKNINVLPDYVSPTGDTLKFYVEQYFNNQTLLKSDDGFQGKISVRLAPTCDVPENTWENIHWTHNYQKSDAIDGNNSGNIYPNVADKVRYRRAILELSSANPWQDVNQRSVVWDYKVKNTSSNGSDNAWLHLNTPNNIIIDSIVNDQTGIHLTLQNDIYLIGSISAGNTADLSIYGTISNCDQVLIATYAGYECSGYPTNFNDFECPFEYLALYVEPKPAAYQTRITTNSLSNSCSNQVELSIEIASVKIAHLYDMEIKLNVGDTTKINVLSSSSEFQYNLNNIYNDINDPSYSPGEYSYDINSINPNFLSEGLVGVMDLENNRYRIKTILQLGDNFVNGDFVNIHISGTTPCNIPLPETNLAFDPSVKFSKNTSANLHLDIINSWSASWGDYNNDGFDDLFVPSKDINTPNLLYKNNHDGTFTKVSKPPLTSNQGASVSGSWGDFDNDGDLDIFVCNNENGANRLFKNTNGNFTDVTPQILIDEGLYSHSSAWADYNKDGFLDLIVTDFHPTHFNRIFKGLGDGSFVLEENSEVSLSAKSSVGVAWGDYDNDGDLDLFVANTNNENNDLYENQNGELVRTSSNPIVNDSAHSVGGVWGDYDNDGDLDLFVTNSKNIEPNFFYENNSNGNFTKITNSVITQDYSNSHGATWIDFDNDGDLDLTVANDQYSGNLFYSNNGDNSFTSLTNAITQDNNLSYGLAWSDFDNDGDYDLYVTNNNNTTNDFFINEKGACTNYISINLEGCRSNRNGIGAMISVKAQINGEYLWQTKHVSTQTSGMAGQNSMSLLFGLSDASIVDSLIVVWPSGIITNYSNLSPNQLLNINEECGSKVCGVIFNDMNGDGIQNNNESYISNQAIEIQPGGYRAYTNAVGQYQLFLPDGNYNLTWVNNTNWKQTFPTSNGNYALNIDKSSNIDYCGNDFALNSICIYPDLSIDLGTTAFRRGLPNQLDLAINNEAGNPTEAQFTVKLTMSDVIYLQDIDWNEGIADEGERVYTKTFTGMSALSDSAISLTDSVGLEANIDDHVFIKGEIEYNYNECDLTNNLKEFQDLVVGSIDPNDKLVYSMDDPTSEFSSVKERLFYKIRFQNIGNYAARIVLIEDYLSSDLDWSSLEILTSSHPFDVSFVEGKLRWYNQNIELPDSTSDLEGSQGYVSFSILPNNGLSKMTRVENEASIRFDYNEPIITNVASIYVNEISNENENYLHIRPNPTNGVTQVMTIVKNEPVTDIESVSVYNASGMQIPIDYNVQGAIIQFNVSDLSKGVYIIETELDYGVRLRGKIIVI